jgi:hypothetical protein
LFKNIKKINWPFDRPKQIPTRKFQGKNFAPSNHPSN